MNGVSKTHTARGGALVALLALVLGIGSASAAHPAANGLIAFVQGGSIHTIHSDGSNLSGALATGNNPSFSPDGTTIAYDDGTDLWTMTSTGGSQALVPGTIAGTQPVWINATTLAFTGPGPTSQIEEVPVGGGTVTPLTANGFINRDPAASPDGKQIAYASNQNGTSFQIYVLTISTLASTQVSSDSGPDARPAWSPDGSTIAYVGTPGANTQILTTGGAALTSDPVNHAGPSYSPDGTSIAISTPTGLATIPAGGGSPAAISGTAGATAPDWQDAVAVNQTLPQISPVSAPVVGTTITTSNGTWTGVNTYSYQWLRCDAGGANCIGLPNQFASTYVVQPADLGASVTLRSAVTATNAAGAATVQSPIAGHVLPAWPVNFAVPTISAAQPHAFPNGVVITGTAGTWTGIAPITYSFQWQWCDYANPPQCEDIPGAISSSYAPSGDYINHTLQLKVTAKNSAGSDIAYSRRSYPVLGDAPVNTVSPKILAGSIEIGSTITSDTGTFAGSTPFHFTYQWQRCQAAGQPCTAITGATSSSYVLQPADQGWTIRSYVTATNGGGSYTGQSNHTFPILPKTRFGPANSDPPTLAGKPVPGSTLVATSGSWTGEAPIHYTYTWLHCDATGQDCTAIPNVAGTTYKLKVSDVGYTIKLLVTGRNALAAATVNSDPTDVIVQLPPEPKGRKITGTSKNDYLAGGGGPDIIKGLGGNDTIMGGGGNDYLYGGDGNDVIDGGPGADHIYGGKGSDTIFAADGQRDWIDCGPGVDKAVVDAIDVVKNCESISMPLSPANIRRGR